MNILLVYPEFLDALWSFKHALKFINKRANTPPLCLLTVAAMLPVEWTKRLVDLNVMRLTEEDLLWADYVFISAMAVQRKSVQEIIERCKEAGVKVVAGGPLFINEYEQFEGVDHFILNEAELTLPYFLDDLGRGCAKRVYKTSEFADIKKTPIPLWELTDLRHYASMSIQFSRGCPFHCEFCNVTTLFGNRPRIKTVEQILAELNSLYNIGWRGSVFFVDDNLIGNKRYIKTELLPALIEWKKSKTGTTFYTEASINLADDEELMQLMGKAGFDMVFIGIETPDEKSLDECGKKQNKNRDLLKDVKRIQQAGLQVQGGFIIGFDNDTPSIFKRQIDFIQKSGIVMANVAILQAPTGSKLYERLRREGRLLGQMGFQVVDSVTNFIPNMDLDTLQEGYKEIMRYIYSPRHYYHRIKTLFLEYKPLKIDIPKSIKNILSLLRSIYYLGIIGKERFHYWKLLLWTSIHRPKLIPLAIRLSIYGHHYRKIVE
ncbi:MAG TPA: B12-binding domain-containing radical SAM protein, partial [Candidatus Wunengus californicus]|uniref:B12-binding domain-containing radical SAM protein n=1 Tax=Candidatus Wunengus californicus TaxID=3367619 RepID=UPI004026AC34